MSIGEIFSNFVGLGVVVGIRDEKTRFVKGVLKDFDDPFLVLTSFGKLRTVHKDLVLSIRETEGVVP